MSVPEGREQRHKGDQTPELIEQLLEAHIAAEIADDLQATLGSMCTEPRWECPPLNFRVTGVPAVREFYRRILKNYVPRIKGLEELSRSFGAGQGVIEHIFTMEMPDGTMRKGHHIALAVIENGQMACERVYFDGIVEEVFRWALGEDFFALPGVTPLNPE